MRKVLGFGSLACFACAGALAADLPMRRMPVYAPPPPIPVFTWTGFYAGANAGYAFDGDTSYGITASQPNGANAIAIGQRPGSIGTKASGFTGGGQIGFNYQLGNTSGLGGLGGGGLGGAGLVAGLEADAAYTDLRASNEFDGPLGLDRSLFASRLDFLGTVRGRIGVAFDRLLVYGTGGFAYGGANDDITYYFSPIRGPNYLGNSDTIRPGVAYGGGVEYAIPTGSFLNPLGSAAVTVKAEYLHYDLGTSTIVMNNLLGLPNTYAVRIRDTGNLVRAGLNYNFDLGGAPASPVAARY